MGDKICLLKDGHLVSSSHPWKRLTHPKNNFVSPTNAWLMVHASFKDGLSEIFSHEYGILPLIGISGIGFYNFILSDR